MFARFKLRFDPIFSDLPRMLAAGKDIRIILDIGCGYGVPACWCLEHYPGARIVAIDPDPERVRIAGIALGDRGSVSRGWAPDLPPLPGGTADVVLLLDMLQFLDDGSAAALVQRCRKILAPGGIIVLRFTILPVGRPSWVWRLEDVRIRVAGRQAHYRTPAEMAELLQAAGFRLIINEVSANPELGWLVAAADQK